MIFTSPLYMGLVSNAAAENYEILSLPRCVFLCPGKNVPCCHSFSSSLGHIEPAETLKLLKNSMVFKAAKGSNFSGDSK